MTTPAGVPLINPNFDNPVSHGQLEVELEAARSHASELVAGIQQAFSATQVRFGEHEQVLQAHVSNFQEMEK